MIKTFIEEKKKRADKKQILKMTRKMQAGFGANL